MNDRGSHFQHINEYCLLDIFSEKSIDLMDLCALAETCRRFRRTTQRIAPKKLLIEKPYGSDGYIVENTERTRENVEKIFKSFGSNFSALDLRITCTTKKVLSYIDDINFRKNYFILDLVISYCNKADNLKSLTIGLFNITKVVTVKLKPIFKRLQKLHLCCIRIEHNATLFTELDSLVQLVVQNVDDCSMILENRFHKLERFAYGTHLNFCRRRVETLSTFISRHKTLNTLEVRNRVPDSILQVIVRDCSDLNELNIDPESGEVSFRLLQTLKSLTAMKICGPLSFENFELFSVLNKLSELTLNSCRLPEDGNEFCKLNQLTKLRLSCCYRRGVLLNAYDIVTRLVNLNELSIDGIHSSQFLDEATFSKIIDIVKGRPNVLTLKCKSNFKVNENVDKNSKVVLLGAPRRNRNPWVFIE